LIVSIPSTHFRHRAFLTGPDLDSDGNETLSRNVLSSQTHDLTSPELVEARRRLVDGDNRRRFRQGDIQIQEANHAAIVRHPL
jgi:hypothetical protein